MPLPAPAAVAPVEQPAKAVQTPQTARVAAPSTMAAVRRTASSGAFVSEQDVEPPEPGAVRARRLVEADGGYLDLSRSRDGKRLWASRGWDDGTSFDWRFELEANQLGWSDTVLQFVDGLTEPRPDPKAITMDEELGVSEAGPYRQLAEAWLVSAEALMAMRPPWSAPVPLVHVGNGRGDPKPLQWMVYRAHCPELGKACVYYGRAPAVAKHVSGLEPRSDADADGFWIFPGS